MTAASIRARVRAEMTEEIKAIARRHLAADGANLSLRAVARDLGVVSSAVYRYFGSRDELLTALILDAYNDLGEACERAEAAVDRADLTGRWLALCHAARRWALDKPHEYALIYGSPVPGYAAPEDTVGPATRPTQALGAILVDGYSAGVLKVGRGERLPAGLAAELCRLAEVVAPGVPAALLARGMVAWTQLFGALSFELFGRLTNVIEDLDAWYDHQMRAMGKLVGLPA